MSVRELPNLSPTQVIDLQDALLANADRLLTSALTLLDLDNVGLARSLAILGMEESGKAIAIHERRTEMGYATEGEPFVNTRLRKLWASHQEKLELVHSFLAEERYWFGTEPSDPAANLAYLGTIKRWTRRHDKLKQRGFYVDMNKVGGVLAPTGVSDTESLADVISHVHQIGWQLRLGEHIEASRQADDERGVPPTTVEEIAHMREVLSGIEDGGLLDSMGQGVEGRRLNNDAYRLRMNANPLESLGKPGYEAETRELMRLAEEWDRREDK